MKTLYLECGMGAAGDMLTAALLELMPDPDAAVAELNGLGIPGVQFSKEAVSKCGIGGTHMTVRVHGEEESEEMFHHHHEHHDHHDHHDHDHDHHDHDHGPDCTCGCHDHDHDHHHHHADEVSSSWGKETPHKYSEEQLREILTRLSDDDECGIILRAKGILPCTDGTWLHFDMVPEEFEVRHGEADYTGRLCVIGSHLNEEELAKVFGLTE